MSARVQSCLRQRPMRTEVREAFERKLYQQVHLLVSTELSTVVRFAPTGGPKTALQIWRVERYLRPCLLDQLQYPPKFSRQGSAQQTEVQEKHARVVFLTPPFPEALSEHDWLRQGKAFSGVGGE